MGTDRTSCCAELGRHASVESDAGLLQDLVSAFGCLESCLEKWSDLVVICRRGIGLRCMVVVVRCYPRKEEEHLGLTALRRERQLLHVTCLKTSDGAREGELILG